MAWLKRLFGGKKRARKEDALFERDESKTVGDRATAERDGSPATQVSVSQREERKRNGEATEDLFRTAPDARREGIRTAMATHIGTRERQQDAVYATGGERFAFGVLCDGIGGMDDGERASGDVVEYLVNRIAGIPMDADIPAFFEREVSAANELILTRYGGNGHAPGTTLAAVVMCDSGMYWAAVGDSRIYIIRQGGMVRVTRDHNYAMQLQEQVDAGKMTQEEADANPLREALVSYIGAPALEIVDISRGAFPLEEGDIALLCSDGLNKSLSDSRILELLRVFQGDLDEAARMLPLVAFDEGPGNQDNTSVILMQYVGPVGEERP